MQILAAFTSNSSAIDHHNHHFIRPHHTANYESYLHHEQRKYLVLLLDLAGPDGVTVVIVGEDNEAAVGTDEEETSDTKHIPPDGP